ncbi:MAG TPA: holo-ACP synthase [Burkholderiaceae bacterium]|nr:holo-ACP synthase [Burkholderiaceae bacterium]
MIYGIGTDVVQVERIVDLLTRYGDRFARRVLGPDELAEFQRRRSRGGHGPAYSARYLAKRFAAKEAYSKALGLGLRGPMTLLSLQVLNNRRGQPVALPRKALADYVRERGLVAHVSLSDEIDSAVAFVIIEQQAGAAPTGPGSDRGAGEPAPDARPTDRRES